LPVAVIDRDAVPVPDCEIFARKSAAPSYLRVAPSAPGSHGARVPVAAVLPARCATTPVMPHARSTDCQLALKLSPLNGCDASALPFAALSQPSGSPLPGAKVAHGPGPAAALALPAASIAAPVSIAGVRIMQG
jgi:hypothetical protein